MERLEEVIKYYVGGEGERVKLRLEVGISEVCRLCEDVEGRCEGRCVKERVLKERCDMDVEEYHKYIFGAEELKYSLYSRYI